jgi:RNA polymerase sigma-70 factor (ECF subfamily)
MPESPEPDLADPVEQDDPQVTGAAPGGSEGVVDDELSELVQAARAGDQDAFAQLVRATHRDTFTLAVRLTGNEEDARDVTQEAYLRAYRGLSRFRGDAQFSTWMYRITANCASTHLGRRNRHRHDPLPESSEVIDLRTDADPALVSDATDLRDRLLVALDTLPPKLRAVVVLRDVYELSHDAIAEELGISTTAAKVRLHRARHKLRSEVFPELDQVARRAV